MTTHGFAKCTCCGKRRDRSYFRYISFISSRPICYDCEHKLVSIEPNVDETESRENLAVQ